MHCACGGRWSGCDIGIARIKYWHDFVLTFALGSVGGGLVTQMFRKIQSSTPGVVADTAVKIDVCKSVEL